MPSGRGIEHRPRCVLVWSLCTFALRRIILLRVPGRHIVFVIKAMPSSAEGKDQGNKNNQEVHRDVQRGS